jgi:hydroxymethylglutaryl-CoA lyase
VSYPSQIRIREVSPRDGLQSESKVLETGTKVRLIGMLAVARLPQINVTSFVSPRAVPQLADAEDVAALLPPVPGCLYDASVPNMTGARRAVDAGLAAISVFVSVSDQASLRNVRRDGGAALAEAEEVCQYAAGRGVKVIGTLANSFGSPYDGVIPPRRVVGAALRLVAAGADQITLGDTTGEATPRQVGELADSLRDGGLQVPLSLHLHDTRGLALANALAGLQAGITDLDAALGGIGGSPFSDNAAGNLATDDLVHMCEECGVDTGVDLATLIEAYRFLETELGHPLPGRVGRFGPSKQITVIA